jgi:hypothetical protein
MLICLFQRLIWTQDFIDHAEDLLAALLAREVLPNGGFCMQCTDHKHAIWRCKDCTLSPVLCRACMRHCHLDNPLHRVECWTGTFFRSADLWEVGVYLLVKHHSEESACKSISWQKGTLERLQLNKDDEEQRSLSTALHSTDNAVPTAPDVQSATALITAVPAAPNMQSAFDSADDDDSGDEEEDMVGEEDIELKSIHRYLGDTASAASQDSDPNRTGFRASQTGSTPRQDALSNHYVRVVHVNGIHHIALVTCACHGSEAVQADLMYNRLVPTTFSQYRTLFTVAVLDDFRLSNLECKASAYQYFQKLRRHIGNNTGQPAGVGGLTRTRTRVLPVPGLAGRVQVRVNLRVLTGCDGFRRVVRVFTHGTGWQQFRKERGSTWFFYGYSHGFPTGHHRSCQHPHLSL